MMARGPFDPRPDPRAVWIVRGIAAGCAAFWLTLLWMAWR